MWCSNLTLYLLHTCRVVHTILLFNQLFAQIVSTSKSCLYICCVCGEVHVYAMYVMCESLSATTLHACTPTHTVMVMYKGKNTNSINRPRAFKSLHGNIYYHLTLHRSQRKHSHFMSPRTPMDVMCYMLLQCDTVVPTLEPAKN